MTTTTTTLPVVPERPCLRLLGGSGQPIGVTIDGHTTTATTGQFPRFRWGFAPAGLATRRQLAALGLAPVGDPVARLWWRRGRRWADLWPIDTARPKNPPTTAQLSALAAAMRARSTCTGCGTVEDYCLPVRNGRQCCECDPATYGMQAVAA